MRQNLIMYGIHYNEFTAFNDDTIEHDNFGDKKFQVQVANPPFSAKWSANSKFKNDPRFSDCGVLAPKSYADLMFLQHIVYNMDEDGRAAVLLLFRGNKEESIRRYLIENQNVIDAVIGLPANCFHGTPIPVCCIVLRKNRNKDSDNIWFCDASKYYKSGKNMNELSDEGIDCIVNAYEQRTEVDKFSRKATLDEIKKNSFNLDISQYINTFEEEEQVDIQSVRLELIDIIAKKQAAIDKIDKTFKLLGL